MKMLSEKLVVVCLPADHLTARDKTRLWEDLGSSGDGADQPSRGGDCHKPWEVKFYIPVRLISSTPWQQFQPV